MFNELSQTLRMLCIDTVVNANSGHLGMPLGMADVATTLFKDFLVFNPQDPTFIGRDKFVLSCGHGSAMLYSILYLTGYKGWSIDDLKQFRKLGSKTPGHPEFAPNLGIEISTGPLGQGIANAVGMAISAKKLTTEFPELAHNIYVFGSDGDFMEGISHEALSLAGTLNLDNLIIFYDDNNITIDGNLELSCQDNKIKRFESYNFFVQQIDGHDYNAINYAILNAKLSKKPSIILCKTRIGYGIPEFEGTSKIHGKIPPADIIDEVRKSCNWTPFSIPNKILNKWHNFWERNISKYEICKNTKISHRNIQFTASNLSTDGNKNASTKTLFNEMISQTQNNILIGGSADLSESNGTKGTWMQDITTNNFYGNYINYGIREHAMGAIANGINSSKIFYAYIGTFLSFSDYMRPAIRMAAMMRIPSMFVFSHDSIFIGEDGPTHQPIEQIDSLNLIPNLYVFRPYNNTELHYSLMYIFESACTASLLLTRQKVEDKSCINEFDIKNGAYIIKNFSNTGLPKIIIIASGSEVEIAFNISELTKNKFDIRIISVPCFKLFHETKSTFKNELLLLKQKVPTVVIEASTAILLSSEISHNNILSININSFGCSADKDSLKNHFGFSEKNIIEKIGKMFHVKHS